MKWAKIFALVSLGCFCISLCFVSYRAYINLQFLTQHTVETLDHVNNVLDEAKSTIKDVHDGYNDTYYDQKAAIESTAALAKKSYDTMQQLDSLISEGIILLHGIESTVEDLDDQSHEISDAAKKSLENIATLMQTLDAEVKENSPNVGKTFEDLDKAIQNLDVLISDQNIKSLLSESSQTAHNINESTKSIDIALRPLREKLGTFKLILRTIFNVVKVTIPLPF